MNLTGISIPAIDAEMARQSLKEYIRQAWHVVEPGTPFISGWCVDAICDHLEAVTRRDIRRLLINIPPRHQKSLTACVFWPTWDWITTPTNRWMFLSYAESLSIRDSLQCRRIIESNWYQANWGPGSIWGQFNGDKVFKIVGDQNEKKKFENDKTGYRIASSVGGTATGDGGDFIVVDDPHNARDIDSDTIRQGVLDWHDRVMPSRFNNPKTGCEVVVMQRLHESDLSGHLLSQGGWEHLKLPAEYDGSDLVAA